MAHEDQQLDKNLGFFIFSAIVVVALPVLAFIKLISL